MDIRSFFGAKPSKVTKQNDGVLSKNDPVTEKKKNIKENTNAPEKLKKHSTQSMSKRDTKDDGETDKKRNTNGTVGKGISKKSDTKRSCKGHSVNSSPDEVVEIVDSDSSEFVTLPQSRKDKRIESKKEHCKGSSEHKQDTRKENAKLNDRKRKSCVEDEADITGSKRRREDAEEKFVATKKPKEEKKEKSGKKNSTNEKEIVCKDVKLRNADDSDEYDVKVKRRASSMKKGGVIYDSDSDDGCVSPTPQKKGVKRARSKTKHGNVILDSDSSDVVSPSPERKKKAVRRRSKKDRCTFSDSDDEHAARNTIADAFARTTPHVEKPVVKATPQKEAARKTTSAADFFGTAVVQRVETRTATHRTEAKTVSQEAKVHSDDDFTNTLQQLDANENVKVVKPESKSKEATSGSLSSKLAAKVVAVSKTSDPKSQSETFPESCTADQQSTKEITPEKQGTTCIKSRTPTKTATPPKKSPSSSADPSPTSPSKNKVGAEKDTPKRTGYWAYRNREGPRAPGSKQIPQGGANCMEGMTFVLTGVLDSMERDEARLLIERHGGKVTTSISRRTNYMVAGCDAGESKLAKAREFHTKQIDEDGLLDLLRTLPAKRSKYEVKAAAEMKEEKATKTPCTEIAPSVPSAGPGEVEMWVDKYRPRNVKQLIGQSGDQSCARKLSTWLKAWHRHLANGTKPAFNRFGGDGAGHRAALLSGPPGIGKTSTAQLVAQEAGFTYIELNASDTRSKKSLQEEVANALSNHSVARYFGSSTKTSLNAKHHCLLMDEVDGMAGNEDRGGIQELVQLIKHTQIPIICMCNDRNHMKMRTLSNYAFDLRFQRPRVEQIKAAMMTIAYKEGLKIPAPAMNEIIEAANHDIRQVIHNLSLWTANEKTPSFDQLKDDAGKARKDIKLGPFDVCRKVFMGGEEKARMSFTDKSDLFFHDYSFSPLFVQENYIHVTPFSARGDVKKHLQLLSSTADSICDGDLVDRLIRGAQNWSLLPLQAVYASVLPGEYLQGHLDQMIQFPSWLGRNSSRTKHDRLLQQLATHMTLKVSSDRRGINLDYLPHLRSCLTRPLMRDGSDGVNRVIDVMQHYDLTRDDFDAVLELTQWSGSKDPMASVETKVKSAFTRAYNKLAIMTPYAMSAPVKKGRQTQVTEDGEDDLVEEAENEDDDDVGADAMIKQKKKATASGKKKTNGASDVSTAGKGKGKGTGKGKGRGKK